MAVGAAVPCHELLRECLGGSRLLMKLDAHDRAQLVMIAYETRLVMPS